MRRALLALTVTLLPLPGCTRPAPTGLLVEEHAFTFRVPRDWFPAEYDAAAKTYVPGKGHGAGALQPGGHLLYASPAGDAIYLEFEPGGHGLEFDLEWTVEVKDDRLVLLKEGPLCTHPPPDPGSPSMDDCRAGDGSLTIQVAPWEVVVRGHRYFIQFLNVRREQGVDHQPFRDILASFRAR